MDSPISRTPEPPYTAVIFTSTRAPSDQGDQGYGVMSARMDRLAQAQSGYLGHESAKDESLGITVSYWIDHAAAAAWKQVAEHLIAQERGREVWYSGYTVRVATVEREYSRPMDVSDDTGALPGDRD